MIKRKAEKEVGNKYEWLFVCIYVVVKSIHVTKKEYSCSPNKRLVNSAQSQIVSTFWRCKFDLLRRQMNWNIFDNQHSSKIYILFSAVWSYRRIISHADWMIIFVYEMPHSTGGVKFILQLEMTRALELLLKMNQTGKM